MKRYKAVFYENDHKNKLLQIDDADNEVLISRSTRILDEEYHDAYCVIEDCEEQSEVMTLKRCGIE